MTPLPLAGRRILVTRAAHQAGKLSDALRALGAEPVEVPVLEIHPPASYDPLDQAIRHLDNYDWLILTSANTVRALASRIETLQLQIAAFNSLKIAAIGDPTAAAARAANLQVSLVPRSYIAESLIEELLSSYANESAHNFSHAEISKINMEASTAAGTPHRHNASGHDFSRAEDSNKNEGASAPAKPSSLNQIEGEPLSAASSAPAPSLTSQRILIARAAIARDILPDALRTAGAQVTVVDAYQNILPQDAPEKLREALASRIHAATFTSSSTVTHLAQAAKIAGIAFPLANIPAISIGPITSQTLRHHNWPPAAEAATHDLPGLVDAAVRVLHNR